MKTARHRLFPCASAAALAGAAILAAASCSNAALTGAMAAKGDGKSFSVNVCVGAISSSKNGLAKSGLIADADVLSVLVHAYDAITGASVSSGSQTLTKKTGYWSGRIDVSETGSVLFQAYAYNKSGSLAYVGETTKSVQGAGTSLSIDVWQVGLMSGTIQKPAGSSALSLAAATSYVHGANGLSNPFSATSDGLNLYIADNGSRKIIKVTISSGVVTSFAGTGATGSQNDSASGSSATFNSPRSIATDGSYLYVSDYLSWTAIRRISIATSAVSTLVPASTHAMDSVYALTSDATYLYVADNDRTCVDRIAIADGALSTIVTASAGMSGMYGIGTDNASLYVVDTGTQTIWKMNKDGTGIASFRNDASLYSCDNITLDGKYLYFASYNSKIGSVDLATKTVSTLAVSYNAWGICTNGSSLFLTGAAK